MSPIVATPLLHTQRVLCPLTLTTCTQMKAAVSYITPVVILVGWRLPGIESFVGLNNPVHFKRSYARPSARICRPTLSPGWGTLQQDPRCRRPKQLQAATEQAPSTVSVKEDPYEVEAGLVEEDKAVYLGLLALQLVPSLLVGMNYAPFVYFGVLAVSTVYLGAKRQDIPDERTTITTRQAIGAPLASSIALFSIFLVVKYTDVSVGVAYQVLTTLLAIGSAVSILPPIVRAALPPSVANLPVSAPLDAFLAKIFPKAWEDDDQPLLDFAELAVLVSSVSAAFVYLNPEVGLSAKFLIPNLFAWCIGMQSIGLISITSFTAAAVLLTGLFCYDIFWVFGTEVMMTVATRLEAPVKFLFPSITDPSRQYPFSVLGLGDIVIPATFCTLMRSFDKQLEDARQAEAAAARALAEEVSTRNPVALWLDSFLGTPISKAPSVGESTGRISALPAIGGDGISSGGKSYFESSLAAYALGLGLCFTVNFLSRSGQPALLYLNPLLLASAFATAAVNGDGELQKLLAFAVEKSSSEEAAESST